MTESQLEQANLLSDKLNGLRYVLERWETSEPHKLSHMFELSKSTLDVVRQAAKDDLQAQIAVLEDEFKRI